MNRIITTLTACLLTIAIFAQEKTIIKVSYAYHYFTVRGYEVDRPMILIADKDCSKFYNPMTNWIDSLNSTPEGRAEYLASKPKSFTSDDIGKIPTRWEKMYVYKDRKNNSLKRYDTIASERFYYEEPLSQIEWVITDSTKNILDYECVMATADYHGRQWTVWFTPEIPVNDGPWKLEGLPGLIMEASESTGQYSFSATGLETGNEEVPPVYEEELYEKLERKELLKHKRFFAENMGAIITAQTSAKNLYPSQLKSLELKTDLDFLETDYK
ncbi:MAG: GLPGLI family protein [Staphylococcus sp.]|nr:GLPGLI family protein [Staphylococcus sp.]